MSENSLKQREKKVVSNQEWTEFGTENESGESKSNNKRPDKENFFRDGSSTDTESNLVDEEKINKTTTICY